MITLETLVQLDHRVWPVAVLACLRVVTVFLFLPVFGDQAVPARVRIGLAIVFTAVLWPSIGAQVRVEEGLSTWSPLSFGLVTLREVFFGYAAGFAGRLLLYAGSISASLVGANMGFQAMSLFNPASQEQDSSFSSFKGWLVLMCLLGFEVHHMFLRGLAESFATIPIGAAPHGGALAGVALEVVKSCFLLGIRLAAPLLLVQLLVTLALGLLNRALPQLNALVMQFPLSFGVSMIALFFSAAAFVRLLGGYGIGLEQQAHARIGRAFVPGAAVGSFAPGTQSNGSGTPNGPGRPAGGAGSELMPSFPPSPPAAEGR